MCSEKTSGNGNWKQVWIYEADATDPQTQCTCVEQLESGVFRDSAPQYAELLRGYRTHGYIHGFFLLNDGQDAPSDDPSSDGPRVDEIDWTGLDEYIETARQEVAE